MTARLYGHRDFVQTTCPGNRYREWVPKLREVLMSSPLDTKVPAPTSSFYQPYSEKLPTWFGGKWPAWTLLQFIWYSFRGHRRHQDALKALKVSKLAWTSTYEVPAQANGAPKRGPHQLRLWLTYFWRWNWDRQKEHKALKARVFALETKLAALSTTEIAKEEAIKAVGEKLLS